MTSVNLNPLVSVIIPTKNSARFLEACLQSIKSQTYQNYEIIVVDNHSTDETQSIARKYTHQVYEYGPERSAQRNRGAEKSTGEYLMFVDSDMELSSNVIQACVDVVSRNEDLKAVNIPEQSIGEGFWAECKKLEKSFYVGVDWMEAPHFFEKQAFQEFSGYREDLISGEDWDLSQKIKSRYQIGRIDEIILHNEGRISLISTIKKKFYYAQNFARYMNSHNGDSDLKHQTGIISRYWLFLKDPYKLFRNPILGFGMLFMKTCEFGVGGIGYIHHLVYK